MTLVSAPSIRCKSRVDISKAQRLLDFQPAIELREGLALTAEWYRKTLVETG